jgi:hypothetical protein
LYPVTPTDLFAGKLLTDFEPKNSTMALTTPKVAEDIPLLPVAEIESYAHRAGLFKDAGAAREGRLLGHSETLMPLARLSSCP